jgi:hypothetical protein
MACIDELLIAQSQHLVLLDDRGFILDEYRRCLSPSGQPGPGDAFFKWLWNNQANPNHCRKVPVTPLDSGDTDFLEFPDDPELAGFDRSDRKFVATVISDGGGASVINASDTDWSIFREPLERNGVHVRFICPELMNRS